MGPAGGPDPDAIVRPPGSRLPHLAGAAAFSRRELRAVLDSLPGPAVVVGRDHRILAANRFWVERFAPDQEFRGRFCHEVLHRRRSPCRRPTARCPVESCRDTGHLCRTVHVHTTPAGEEPELITAYPIPGGGEPLTAVLQVIRPLGEVSACPSPDRLVGRSPAFLRLVERLERVARRPTPVLLLGEPGSGRKLVARTLHRIGGRRGLYAVLSCSEASAERVAAKLFGRAPGVLADSPGEAAGLVETAGLVEAADRGTLYLEDVECLSPGYQVRLLRLLETGRFRRLGGAEQIAVDVRVVCSAGGDPAELVAAGALDRDLASRLNAFPLWVPPLRERAEDLPLLAASILQRLAGEGAPRLAPQTLALLEGYPFPGNVSELADLLERSLLRADGDVLLPEHLPEGWRASA